MEEPLVIAAIVSMIGILAAAIIGGLFAFLRNNRGKNSINPSIVANGLLAALQSQTKALSDLTEVLREGHTEDRRAHEKMNEALTKLLERTKGNPE